MKSEKMGVKQVKNNVWETENGVKIWRNDFGDYEIKNAKDFEIANTFEKAVKIARSERFSKQEV